MEGRWFNTSIYVDRDHYRGIFGSQMVPFTNRNDIDRLAQDESEIVSLTTVADDGVHRQADGFTVTSSAEILRAARKGSRYSLQAS